MSQQERDGPERNRRDRAADWSSLTVSAVIVLLLVGLVGYQYAADSDQPAIIVAEPKIEEVREADGVYYLPVEVTNHGGKTVESVTVSLSLQTPSGQETSDFQLQFLAGDEIQTGTVVFQEDPTQGGLTVGPISYVRP